MQVLEVMVKACKKCGEEKPLTEFYVDNSKPDKRRPRCKMCVNSDRDIEGDKIRNKKWREKNKKYHKAKCKEWNDRNREQVLAKKSSQWHSMTDEEKKEHYQKRKAGIKKWQRRNWDKIYKRYREQYIEKSRIREGVLVQQTPEWADKEKIKRIYRTAQIMSSFGKTKYHVDHIIPLKNDIVSGLHVENNLQIITASENLSKGNKFEGNKFGGVSFKY